MATQKPGMLDARASAADLTGKEYYLAKIDSNGDYAMAAAGEDALGTIQEGKTAGAYSTVMLSGITKVVAGASFNPGVRLMSDANGKAITAVGAAGNYVVGVALTASGGDLEVVEMLIDRQGILA